MFSFRKDSPTLSVLPGKLCRNLSVHKAIWVATWQNQQNDLCTQPRLRSAWASAQSHQSSPCTKWVAEDPVFLHVDSEGWSYWADAQTDLSLCWAHIILLVLSCGGLSFKYTTKFSLPKIACPALVYAEIVAVIDPFFVGASPWIKVYRYNPTEICQQRLQGVRNVA